MEECSLDEIKELANLVRFGCFFDVQKWIDSGKPIRTSLKTRINPLGFRLKQASKAWSRLFFGATSCKTNSARCYGRPFGRTGNRPPRWLRAGRNEFLAFLGFDGNPYQSLYGLRFSQTLPAILAESRLVLPHIRHLCHSKPGS